MRISPVRRKSVFFLCMALLCLALGIPGYASPVGDRSAQTPAPPEQAGPAGEGQSPALDSQAPDSPAGGIPVLSVPASQSRLVVIPETPRRGEPLLVGFVPAEGPDAEDPNLRVTLINTPGQGSGQSQGQGQSPGQSPGQRLAGASLFTLALDPRGRPLKAAVLAVPSTARAGPALIRVESGTATLGEISLTIAGREFISEEIFLNQDNTDIRTQEDPQKTAESAALWAILSRTGREVYAAGPFIAPVDSPRRTSFFGDRRVYRYINGKSDTSIHAGVDYGVPRGTPVRACAPGRVVLARFRIVTGNSVILEHLPGVYSLYYHLDTIAVAEETLVDAGTLLGESGSTGLSTGPHLHWEIRAAGENADPDAFLSRPILDKEALLRKIDE